MADPRGISVGLLLLRDIHMVTIFVRGARFLHFLR
jgi:hypothetical protein